MSARSVEARKASDENRAEPSDAQVEAALSVYDPLFPPVGNAWKTEQIERMRAALRAASETGGEGR